MCLSRPGKEHDTFPSTGLNFPTRQAWQSAAPVLLLHPGEHRQCVCSEALRPGRVYMFTGQRRQKGSLPLLRNHQGKAVAARHACELVVWGVSCVRRPRIVSMMTANAAMCIMSPAPGIQCCLLPIYRPEEPIAKHLKFCMQRPIPSYAGAVSSMSSDSSDAVGKIGWVLFAVAVLGCLAEEVWHLRKHWHERHLDSAFAAQIHATAAA